MTADHRQIIRTLLETPPPEFRPYPFWFWNGDITREGVEFQLQECLEHGITTVLIHPRYGLQVPYPGEEYLALVRHTAGLCRRLGLKILLYDDYNWPSGTVAGRLLQEHPEYHMQFLRCTGVEAGSGNGAAFEVVSPEIRLDTVRGHKQASAMPGYLDVLNPEAVGKFIEMTHEVYYRALPEYFGSVIQGIFTDEPGMIYDFNYDYDFAGAMSRSFPWSERLEEVFGERHGYRLQDRLADLVLDTPTAVKTRLDYQETVTTLYTESYHKQIFAWCEEHGIIYTGHVLGEENSLHYQGDIYQALKHFHVPGLDWTSKVCDLAWSGFNTAKTVSGIAHALGRKYSVCETFGAAGWGLTLSEMKRTTDHLYALGINQICLHGFFYSLKGARAHECPPSEFFQNPWWRYFKHYSDYTARLGAILSQGEPQCDTGVVVPVHSYWGENHRAALKTEGEYSPGMRRLDDLCRTLLDAGLDYELVFDTWLEESNIAGTEATAVNRRFSTLLLPPVEVITLELWHKLRQFREDGGRVVLIGRAPDILSADRTSVHIGQSEVSRLLGQPAPEEPSLFRQFLQQEFHGSMVTAGDENGTEGGFTALRRRLPDGSSLCFIRDHTGQDRGSCKLSLPGASAATVIDLETGSLQPVDARIVHGRTEIQQEFSAYQSRLLYLTEDGEPVKPSGSRRSVGRQVVSLGPDWRFELKKENCLKIRDLISIPAADGTRADVYFRVACRDRIDQVGLLLEKGTYGRVWVNGTEVTGSEYDCCYFDSDQAVFDIGGYLKTGANRLALEYRPESEDSFISPLMVYAGVHAVQPHIYLTGKFGVDKQRQLTASPEVVYGPWSEQGFPDYAGSAVYRSVFRLEEGAVYTAARMICDVSGGCLEVAVNGRPCGVRPWEPYELDVAGALEPGLNTVEITVTNTAAALLRPLPGEFTAGNEAAYLGFIHEGESVSGLLSARIEINY